MHVLVVPPLTPGAYQVRYRDVQVAQSLGPALVESLACMAEGFLGWRSSLHLKHNITMKLNVDFFSLKYWGYFKNYESVAYKTA